MDEVLKRRLTGAVVLLGGAFLLTWLLPKPTPPGAAGEGRVVTVDLNAPPRAPAPQPIPEAIAAPETAAAESVATEEQEAAAVNPEDFIPTEPQSKSGPEAKSESELTPVPKPSANPAAASGPALKLDSKLTGKPPPAPPKPAPAPQSAWYVQAGSFSDLDKARQELERYTAAGFKGVISPADTPNGTFYRVRLGPYPAQTAAEQARVRLASQGSSQAKVVED